MKKLLIEGYRAYAHSYALVVQSHCLSLLRRGGFDLRFTDLPPRPQWHPTLDIFSRIDERALSTIAAPESEFEPEVTLRYSADFKPPKSGRKFDFATSEHRLIHPKLIAGIKSGFAVPGSVHILTPSRWAAEAYRRFGFGPERIHVVPHGVDPLVLRPDEHKRAATRTRYGVDNHFVFLSIGAMTGNKGIDLLLRAFAHTAETTSDAYLILKGVDAVYPSKELLRETVAALPESVRKAIDGRWRYIGDTLSLGGMADLMRAADCYVSPYFAEGFNMPVLEAAACGTPVICTEGGPTDEFTEPSSTWRIRSTPVGVRVFGGSKLGEALKPDLDHLTELIGAAMNDRDKAKQMGAAAASHVAQHYTWDLVTDRLIAELFPGA